MLVLARKLKNRPEKVREFNSTEFINLSGVG